MNKIKFFLLAHVILLITATACSQTQTFDLVTYAPPKGWKKETRATVVSFSKKDDKAKTWCIINIVKSTASKGSIDADFENDWQELMVKPYKMSAAQTDSVQEADGWKAKSGAGTFTFNNANAIGLLNTFTGYNTCVSIATITNSETYLPDVEKFLNSLDIKNPRSSPNTQNSGNTGNNSAIPPQLINYTWKSTQNRKDVNGYFAGYSSNTYQFKSNGTYTFNNTAFQNYTPKYNITDEEGTYQVSGNTIILKPTKNRYHVHQREKTDPATKSGNLALETTQYTLVFTVINDKQRLVLSPSNGKETKRDGTFNYYANGEKQKSYLYDAATN
jgi:hypothetical protein